MIRFTQFDVPWKDVHDDVSGVPLPANCEGWEPFQVEIRGTPDHDQDAERHLIRLAVWMRRSA